MLTDGQKRARHPPVARVCERCRAAFHVHVSQLATRRSGRYCSAACYRSYTLVERFEAKVAPCPMSGCHLWLAGGAGSGYGTFQTGGHKPVQAHRVSWELYRGPIPDGLWVLHRCDVRCCVNPNHLFLGTVIDNNADRDAKGRHVKALGDRNGTRSKPWTRPRGEAAGSSKLRADQALAIFNDPRPSRLVAREYGIGKSAVLSIRQAKTWRHVLPTGGL